MKVLMVSKACYVAAYRRKLEELAALPGVDLALVVPPYWQTGPRKSALEPGYDRGYCMVVENPIFNGNFHLHFYRRLPELLHTFRPDIVHMDEEPYDYVTFHAARAARGVGARVLFFTWQNFLRWYPPPFAWFEAYVLKHVHGAIAGNQEGARLLRRKGYTRPLFVIPQFGIDPELFFPAEGPAPPQVFTPQRPFRIGFSGRLVEEKGLNILLQALAGLSAEQMGADGTWELRFIGEGPLRPRLEQEARELGLSRQVRFVGTIPSDQVPQQLRELDALVNPSLTWKRDRTQWKEQFGRSLVEAMACGVPVIGSDSGEIPNVVGDAGIIVPEGDTRALRAQMLRLMEDPGLRRELGRRGRARVLAHYTQQRIAQQTYTCYQQILGEP